MSTDRPALPPVTRPDGSLYRPRKLSAQPVGDEDEIICGVIVFGTHDAATAQLLANQVAGWEAGKGAVAGKPQRVWWSDCFENGRRIWITDEKRGRAGVWFSEITEALR